MNYEAIDGVKFFWFWFVFFFLIKSKPVYSANYMISLAPSLFPTAWC